MDYIWIIILIVIFIAISNNRTQITIRVKIIKNKTLKNSEKHNKDESMKSFIGKQCKIAFLKLGIGSSSITGVISEVNNGWIQVETRYGTEIIRTMYIENVYEVKGV